ncbi:hypothetical protein Clacol_005635 [Clathrus columnatus]|uniref:C2H2-type domain-containing protein n=1 Tax=Clathrus columnatus TaxID=1419009 RepID=A0AAV5A9V4_9AGAM|nr:hypothetical protein Clacol_005635 [Clathrus columnatus]
MIENSKTSSFLEPDPVFSPDYYMDSVVAKDSPASLSSVDSSPLHQLAYPSWDADDGSPVTVINPALIAKPKGCIEKGEEFNVKQEDKTESSDIALRIEGTQVHNSVKQEDTNEDSDFALQLAGSRIHSSLPPLDLISLRSYDVLNIPMKKICRGRRVPTVEMVQKRAARTVVDVVEKKPGRDTFAERRFVCGFVECRKCFKRREHLIRHQRSAHSSEKRKYPSGTEMIMIIDEKF